MKVCEVPSVLLARWHRAAEKKWLTRACSWRPCRASTCGPWAWPACRSPASVSTNPTTQNYCARGLEPVEIERAQVRPNRQDPPLNHNTSYRSKGREMLRTDLVSFPEEESPEGGPRHLDRQRRPLIPLQPVSNLTSILGNKITDVGTSTTFGGYFILKKDETKKGCCLQKPPLAPFLTQGLGTTCCFCLIDFAPLFAFCSSRFLQGPRDLVHEFGAVVLGRDPEAGPVEDHLANKHKKARNESARDWPSK